MITQITQETLAFYLPFTRDVKGSKIYESYKQGLAQADEKLKVTLLGRTVYDMLQEAFEEDENDNDNEDDNDNDNENQNDNENEDDVALSDTDYRIGCKLADLKAKMIEYICNEAAYQTLGHHNVMQSSLGGFTTATGQNEMVANQSRVDDLRDECQRTAELAMDVLVKMLIGNKYIADTVRESNAWKNKTKFFFWSADEAREHVSLSAPGYMSSGSKDVASLLTMASPLERYAKEINDAHSDVQKQISREQVAALIGKMRSGVVSNIEQEAIGYIRNIYAAMMMHNVTEAMDVAHGYSQLLSLMEEYPTSFASYMQSNAYKARHTEGFVNKVENHGFWF